jgi:hypothetical protein
MDAVHKVVRIVGIALDAMGASSLATTIGEIVVRLIKFAFDSIDSRDTAVRSSTRRVSDSAANAARAQSL